MLSLYFKYILLPNSQHTHHCFFLSLNISALSPTMSNSIQMCIPHSSRFHDFVKAIDSLSSLFLFYFLHLFNWNANLSLSFKSTLSKTSGSSPAVSYDSPKPLKTFFRPSSELSHFIMTFLSFFAPKVCYQQGVMADFYLTLSVTVPRMAAQWMLTSLPNKWMNK